MARPAPADPALPARWTVEQYLRLVDEGVLGPDDKVELLEGVIVAMAPQNEPHAAGVRRVGQALYRVVGERAVVQVQLALVSGRWSVPEPDAAVLPGTVADYDRAHPRTALLAVEVADPSLEQDRLTKRGIYAAAGIPEYWIVNVRDDCVEVRRGPEPGGRRYASTAIARRGERIELVGLPGAVVAVDDLLPSRAEE
jgi:Uma2 family endonuclease